MNFSSFTSSKEPRTIYAQGSPTRRITTPKTPKKGTRANYQKSPQTNKSSAPFNSSNQGTHYHFNIEKNEEATLKEEDNFSSNSQSTFCNSVQDNEECEDDPVSIWTEKVIIGNVNLTHPKVSCRIEPEIIPDLIKNLQLVRDACVVEGRADISMRADASISALKNLHKEKLVDKTSDIQIKNIQSRLEQAKDELYDLQQRITVQEANMMNEFQNQTRQLKKKHKKELRSLEREWTGEDNSETNDLNENESDSSINRNICNTPYQNAIDTDNDNFSKSLAKNIYSRYYNPDINENNDVNYSNYSSTGSKNDRNSTKDLNMYSYYYYSSDINENGEIASSNHNTNQNENMRSSEISDNDNMILNTNISNSCTAHSSNKGKNESLIDKNLNSSQNDKNDNNHRSSYKKKSINENSSFKSESDNISVSHGSYKNESDSIINNNSIADEIQSLSERTSESLLESNHNADANEINSDSNKNAINDDSGLNESGTNRKTSDKTHSSNQSNEYENDSESVSNYSKSIASSANSSLTLINYDSNQNLSQYSNHYSDYSTNDDKEEEDHHQSRFKNEALDSGSEADTSDVMSVSSAQREPFFPVKQNSNSKHHRHNRPNRQTSSEIVNAPISHVIDKSKLNNKVDLKSDTYKKERRLRHYNKSSTLLRDLRRQSAFLLSEGKYNEARAADRMADEIEEREIHTKSDRMRNDFESNMRSMKKRHCEELVILEKTHEVRRAEHEKAKLESLEVLQKRIEKLENELKTASNKQRAKKLYERKSSMMQSRDLSKTKSAEIQNDNRDDITSEVETANLKNDNTKDNMSFNNQRICILNENDQNKSVSSEFPQNESLNNSIDMSHSLNRNAKRSSRGLALKTNLNQTLIEKFNINVNKSLESASKRNPLLKRRLNPTAVSMPFTSRRQVKPGEFTSLQLPPLNAKSQARKILKTANRSYRLNKNYL